MTGKCPQSKGGPFLSFPSSRSASSYPHVFTSPCLMRHVQILKSHIFSSPLLRPFPYVNTLSVMLAPSRKRPLPLLLVLAVTTLLFFYRRDNRIHLKWTSREPQNVNIPANRTLGFGAVVVVSREGSARRHSLLQAANITDIDLTIPQQPLWTEGDVEQFRGGVANGVYKGSILAWMGHRHVLQW